ncbi:peptidoglycan-binding domain-containing protein [Streptomyces sp. RPT161]|uniref:peptidoglycan-binding domain-containing protein n=1 Tax=Streptomyces sp. RPT161 TaxID=3015993 RepID=UPI0022B932BB|nr:peptidoglycan-binding domain-containing protein [Streptomyces sp. RPT161]
MSILSAALVAVLLTTRPWRYEETGTATVYVSARPAFVFQRGQCHRCLVARQAGELRAGYSTTRTAIVDVNSRGWETIEAQCLLRYHGYDPGVPDGEYDERSRDATKLFQRNHGLVADGIVGPTTWRELRQDDERGRHGFHTGHDHRFHRTGTEPPDRDHDG